MDNKAKGTDKVSCGVEKNLGSREGAVGGGVFTMTCYDKDGNLKWTAEESNLVVDVGLAAMVGIGLGATTKVTNWYIGLYGASATNSPNATDTMASHGAEGAGGWTEYQSYDEATRQACTFGAVDSSTSGTATISNSASQATFTISSVSASTVGGAFLVSNSTKGGSTGTLFSAADFQSPGDRSVIDGDTINVTYTFSLSAS